MGSGDVMGTAEVIGTYSYNVDMTTIWDVLFQGLSLFILVSMIVIVVLTMIILIKGIQALGLYIKKNKME